MAKKDGKRVNIDANLLKLLMEIGFLACDTGRFSEADDIFTAVVRARPESAYSKIGLAYVEMNKGDHEKAVSILKNAHTQDPKERDLCNSFLGMALNLAGYNEESRSVLTQVKLNNVNETAVRMANDILERL